MQSGPENDSWQRPVATVPCVRRGAGLPCAQGSHAFMPRLITAAIVSRLSCGQGWRRALPAGAPHCDKGTSASEGAHRCMSSRRCAAHQEIIKKRLMIGDVWVARAADRLGHPLTDIAPAQQPPSGRFVTLSLARSQVHESLGCHAEAAAPLRPPATQGPGPGPTRRAGPRAAPAPPLRSGGAAASPVCAVKGRGSPAKSRAHDGALSEVGETPVKAPARPALIRWRRSPCQG